MQTKTILVVVFAVLSVALAGFIYWQKFIEPTFATSPEFSKHCCGMPGRYDVKFIK